MGPETSADQEKQQCLEIFRDTVGNERSFNVLAIGTSGVGKSAFLNTVMTSFSNKTRWIERAQEGNFQNIGRQITYHFNRYSKDKYVDEFRNVAFPTLFDIAGLEDEDSAALRELLRILLFGKLHEGQSLQELHRDITRNENNIQALRLKYSFANENHKVDRIIFVSSANPDTTIPKRLIEALVGMAHSQEIEIPIYGILTHCDLVDEDDEDFLTKERDFKNSLGLTDNKYLRCRNYCDGYDQRFGTDRTRMRITEIEIPVIKFMTQVCNTDLLVPDTGAKYHEWKIDSALIVVTILVVLLAIACAFLYKKG